MRNALQVQVCVGMTYTWLCSLVGRSYPFVTLSNGFTVFQVILISLVAIDRAAAVEGGEDC
jgi:hypothetical protein